MCVCVPLVSSILHICKDAQKPDRDIARIITELTTIADVFQVPCGHQAQSL